MKINIPMDAEKLGKEVYQEVLKLIPDDEKVLILSEQQWIDMFLVFKDIKFNHSMKVDLHKNTTTNYYFDIIMFCVNYNTDYSSKLDQKINFKDSIYPRHIYIYDKFDLPNLKIHFLRHFISPAFITFISKSFNQPISSMNNNTKLYDLNIAILDLVLSKLPVDFFEIANKQLEKTEKSKLKTVGKRVINLKKRKIEQLKHKIVILCAQAKLIDHLTNEEFDDLFEKVKDDVFLNTGLFK
jgi:hypothetical protein